MTPRPLDAAIRRLLLTAVFGMTLVGATRALAAEPAEAPPQKPSATTPSAPFADAVKGYEHQAGLFDLYRNAKKGQLLLGVKQLDSPFLLVTSLPYGLGSNDVGLDRGQPGSPRMVRFRRHGDRLLLVADNSNFVASSSDPLEVAAAREAFAESVLWAGPIKAEAADGTLLIDFAPFLSADWHGVGDRLKASKQGDYKVDANRSAVLVEEARSFADNTELAALLTFAGGGEGEFVRQVAPEPNAITLRQHVSLVRLPPAGFSPRRYHPASGGFAIGHYDFATPLADSLDVRYQPRFRLERVDPAASRGPVKKPIVFYLDPGTPEPVRSALIEGGNWWRAAFEAAGFEDAYRVELRPAGIDPMDIRYNVVSWVHRYTRGWSYGGGIIDPRSGEILKGSVTLGSQRVRQDLMIAEGLIAPYGKPNEAELKKAALDMALARLRQLSAHEIGHALGFAHNFAASRTPNGSVMDYPHPLLSLGADGRVSLANAYGVGVGPWDKFLVQHAYQTFRPSEEAAALARLRHDATAQGLRYLGDDEGRPPNSAHPDALLWDSGSDTLSAYDRVIAVRAKALADFSPAVLPPDRQYGELEGRLVPIYLLHRYQLEAVIRLVGGIDYDYGTPADGAPKTAPVVASRQREALTRVAAALSTDQLALPPRLVDQLSPPGNDYNRGREYFATRTAPLFDALGAVSAAAGLTSQLLFDPARLNRVAEQHARDRASPGIEAVLSAVYSSSWQAASEGKGDASQRLTQQTVGWVLIDALIATLDGGNLHAPVEAEVRSALAGWRDSLRASARSRSRSSDEDGASRVAGEAAEAIDRYLKDPATYKRHAAPAVPPGAPI